MTASEIWRTSVFASRRHDEEQRRAEHGEEQHDS